MRKAGTFAIVYVQYTICASVPGEHTIRKLYLSAASYAECNAFSEFNIFSGLLAAARLCLGCIMATKGVFGSLALFF